MKSRPDLPFESLPAEVQTQFRQSMDLGDYAYRAGTQSLTGAEALGVLFDAISQYCDAYALHPKNPDAERALKQALEVFGKRLDGADAAFRADARAGLQSLQQRHRVLAQFRPLVALIDELE